MESEADNTEPFAGHSPQFRDGRRNGIKWAITFLHAEARRMNDPHAAAVLNTAALTMAVEARQAGTRRVLDETRNAGKRDG